MSCFTENAEDEPIALPVTKNVRLILGNEAYFDFAARSIIIFDGTLPTMGLFNFCNNIKPLPLSLYNNLQITSPFSLLITG